MRDNLVGTEAIVTGAGRGLGRGIAQVLAGEGARVWAIDRTAGELDETAEIIDRSGGRVRALRADLADPAQCRDLVAEVTSLTSQVHVLVNNAAVLQEAPVSEVTLDEWSLTLATNLTAPFVLTQALLPSMSLHGGSVINVSSRAGTSPFARQAGYCASKYGVEALTRCLALELEDAPVSANTITPGMRIKPTGLTEAEASTAPRRSEWSDPIELGDAFVFLARLTGEVGGLRFDALRLTRALRDRGAEHVLSRIEELAE